VETALYYTLSTIAQTLAGALAVMVAFVLFRLAGIEEVIGVGLEPLKARERKVPYSETAPILKKQGWEALRKLLIESGDELATDTLAPRILAAAHLAWTFRARTAFWLKLSLGFSILDIALCFAALPFTPRIVCSPLATGAILTLAVGLGIASLVLYWRLIWTILGRIADE
jgi:hypothetical protein